jgi:hypothetical protein
MRRQGAIIAGVGGDNSDWVAEAFFFEGAMTASFSRNMCDNEIQSNNAEVLGVIMFQEDTFCKYNAPYRHTRPSFDELPSRCTLEVYQAPPTAPEPTDAGSGNGVLVVTQSRPAAGTPAANSFVVRRFIFSLCELQKILSQ